MKSSAEYTALDRKHLWHPYTRLSAANGPEPLPVIARAEGIWLFDVDGKRYMDAISSWWACTLGHSHPRLIAAIQKQAAILQHSILGNLSHPNAAELAARLSALMPTPERHVFFSGDGSSSVEAALKMAVQYFANTGRPERSLFLSLENSYHGDTTGAVAVGYLEHFHRPFRPILFPVERVPAPAKKDSEPDCLAALERTLRENRGKVAAMIVEPLCQGSAGMLLHSPGHLREMARMCKNEDVLFICDEIATGMGRSGTMFAFEQADIDPDIVCTGKGLTAGYLPVSAAIAKDYIYDTFSDYPKDHTFYHGHTFGGNPIGTALALETLALYADEDILGRAKRAAEIIAKRLDSFSGPAAKTRHMGVMGAVELADSATAAKVRELMFERGVIVRPLGPVVYIMPPLNITDAELGLLLDELEQSCARAAEK